MTTDSVFKQALGATGEGADAPGWTLGLLATPTPAGQVTAIWWRVPSGAQGTFGWRVYAQSGHALLGSGTLAGYVNDGTWQRFAVAAIDITAAQGLAVCLFTSSHGDYSYTSSPGFPVSDGVLAASGGAFANATDAYPSSASGLSYGIDLEYAYTPNSTAVLAASATAATGALAGSSSSASALTVSALAATASAETVTVVTGAGPRIVTSSVGGRITSTTQGGRL